MIPTLTVVVPSRGRPNNIDRLYRAFQGTCGLDTRLVVAVDDDDPHLPGYREMQAHHDRGFDLRVGPRLRMVGTLNTVARTVESPFIGFMGDDHMPRTKGWDTLYLQALHEAGPGAVVYGNDMVQGATMPTQVAMDRRIVTTLGWMVPPVLVHLCADLFWLEVGRALGTLRYLPDVIVEHLHPITGQVEWDQGYVECNSDAVSTADHAAFATYMTDQFPTDIEKLKGAGVG